MLTPDQSHSHIVTSKCVTVYTNQTQVGIQMKYVIAIFISMFVTLTATAGVYSDNFAGHYTAQEVTDLSSSMDKAMPGSLLTTTLVAAPLYEEIGVIGTALAQNESVHWATLKDDRLCSKRAWFPVTSDGVHW